jgi:hypothetical protein
MSSKDKDFSFGVFVKESDVLASAKWFFISINLWPEPFALVSCHVHDPYISVWLDLSVT